MRIKKLLRYILPYLPKGDIRVRYKTQGFQNNRADNIEVTLMYVFRCWVVGTSLFSGKCYDNIIVRVK